VKLKVKDFPEYQKGRAGKLAEKPKLDMPSGAGDGN
jgi:hypothetical protein